MCGGEGVAAGAQCERPAWLQPQRAREVLHGRIGTLADEQQRAALQEGVRVVRLQLDGGG
eukprot:scaffold25090_cov57-Phaeocystis_antarctica.AAC.3